ncbi:hypothetical protein [Microbacterium sp. NPDC056234]|uniref:hypothetical protein n=1 Tax=Microbacterium sp. NPDC056234 TaxID=3345757 RepID=UPI0035DABEEB
MKDALLSVPVSPLERIVLLDMAVAVLDDAPVYTWGQERLARAIGKVPGTKAARSATDRVLSGLTRRGLIHLVAKPHRGRSAEYALAVLDGNAPRSDRGPFSAQPVDNSEVAADNAPRSRAECAPVSDVMRPGLTGAPLTTTTNSLTCNSTLARAAAPMTGAQRRNVTEAVEAADDRCDSIDVLAFLPGELALLDTLPADTRRKRIAAWTGLRSRAEQPGNGLEDDERLHDLLAAHGHVCDDCTGPWATYREETA